MDTIKLTDNNFEQTIIKAFEILHNGGVVVTPSESQYGLSVDPGNKQAVEKIFTIKGRDFDKPLGLVAGSNEIIKKFFLINEKEQAFINKFWPGPVGLELMIKKDEIIQNIVKLTYGKQFKDNFKQIKKVIRVTSDKVLAELSRRSDLPIVSTSANISGQPACYSVEDIIDQFKDNEVMPDFIIDAGSLKQQPPSTMLDLTGDTLVVIREGANFEEVQEFLASLG